MRFPVIVVNFKAYKEATGSRGIELAKRMEKVSKKEKANLIIAPNNLDIAIIAEKVDIPVFAQHADPVSYGSYTGHISPYQLKDLGIKGSILNHSEKKIPLETLFKTLKLFEELNMESIVCVDSLKELNDFLELGIAATCIAIEPPELIGTGKAVSKYKPDLLEKAVKLAEEHGFPLLCGAGIVTGEDVRRAIELGESHVLRLI